MLEYKFEEDFFSEKGLHNVFLHCGMLQFTRLMIYKKVNRVSSFSEAAISRNSCF